MTSIYEHSQNRVNPHEVTAEQIGLDQIANLPMAIEEVIDERNEDYYIRDDQVKQALENRLMLLGALDEDGRLNRAEPNAVTLTPGAWNLVAGDEDNGFYGEVNSDDLIYGNTLANEIGLSAGYAQNSASSWLKFVYKGKVLFVAKRPFRYGVSWEDIYQVGAVYGNGNKGINPSGSETLQDAVVKIDGIKYIVRLLRTSTEDPKAIATGENDTDGTHDSEWNTLMYAVSTHQPPSQETTNWADYSNSQLGLDHSAGNGAFNWTQETDGDTKINGHFRYRFLRGGSSFAYVSADSADQRSVGYGWRPVLEPVIGEINYEPDD